MSSGKELGNHETPLDGNDNEAIDNAWATVMSREQDGPRVGRHIDRSPYRGSDSVRALKELVDVDTAIASAKRGVGRTISLLRPDRRRSCTAWHHKTGYSRHAQTPYVTEAQHLTPEQLDEFRVCYGVEQYRYGLSHDDASMPRDELQRWVNTYVLNLSGVPTSTEEADALTYATVAFWQIVQKGLLDDDEAFNDLIVRLQAYDLLKAKRNKLETVLEVTRGLRRMCLLGRRAASAALRGPVAPFTAVGLYVMVPGYRKDRVTASEVNRGRRRLAIGGLGALAVVLGGGLIAYRFMKTGMFEDFNHPGNTLALDHPDIDTFLPDPKANLPDIVPPDNPPDTSPYFSHEAFVIDVDEGWSKELSDINVHYSPEFMAKIGPKLRNLGYAYWDSGAREWRMNLGSGKIDASALRWVYSQAKEYGALMQTTPVTTAV